MQHYLKWPFLTGFIFGMNIGLWIEELLMHLVRAR